MTTDQERLQKAREVARPLRKRYGTWMLALCLLCIALPFVTTSMAVIALGGGAIILAATIVGLVWHIKLLQALNSL